MRLNGSGVTLDEFRLHDATTRDGHESECAVLVFVRKGSFGTLGNKVNFAGW